MTPSVEPRRARRSRWVAAALLSTSLLGCGLMDAPGTPTLISHRAGAGRAPENSRSAVSSALLAGDAALEVDLVLTRDEIPVLSHDASLNPELCTLADGSPLPEAPVMIKDLSLAQLLDGYRCGGVADPATPGAKVFADRLMTFPELLLAVSPFPDVTLQLDIKQDPVHTLDADTYAEVILAHWNAANLMNPMFITATHPETLRAFKARQKDVTALRIWPNFPPGENTMMVGLGNELTRTFGFQEMVQLVREADADGIAVAFQVADRAAMETVRQAGYKTALWTANKESELSLFCKWPIDYLITDYPERAPCR